MLSSFYQPGKSALYLILLVLMSSCDPSQELHVHNDTKEDLVIRFFEAGNSIHSIKNQVSNWDSLSQSSTLSLQQGETDTIWFGIGTWEVRNRLDTLIKYLNRVEIEYAELTERYEGDELNQLIRNSLTGKYRQLLRFNLADWREVATIIPTDDSMIVKTLDKAEKRPYRLSTIEDLFSIIQLPHDISTSSVHEYVYVEEAGKELLSGSVHVIKYKDREQDVIGSVGMLVDATPADWRLTTKPYKITSFTTSSEKVELWNGLFIGCARVDMDLTHVQLLAEDEESLTFVDRNNLKYFVRMQDDKVRSISVKNER
ncbi:MAG: hypothetical protein AAFP77_09000 [Bacteroidota bacterium]